MVQRIDDKKPSAKAKDGENMICAARKQKSKKRDGAAGRAQAHVPFESHHQLQRFLVQRIDDKKPSAKAKNGVNMICEARIQKC